MNKTEAVDIITQERQLLEQWLEQDAVPPPNDRPRIKDREVTQCLSALAEAARYAPDYEASVVARIIALAEARLNSHGRP